MNFNRLIDRMVSSIFFSLVLAFFSFSFATGKFPPSKEDMSRAYHLIRQMMSGTKELKQTAAGFADSPPSLQQMAEFQKMQLRLTQTTLELTSIFEKIPSAAPNQNIVEKLTAIEKHLAAAEAGLSEVAADMQKQMQAPQVEDSTAGQ